MDQQEEIINRMRSRIAETIVSGLDLQDVLHALVTTEWEVWIAEAKERQENWHIVACSS